MASTGIHLQLTWKDGRPSGTACAAAGAGAAERGAAVAFEGWLELADAVRALCAEPEEAGRG